MLADPELAAQYRQMVLLEEAAAMLRLRAQTVQPARESLRLQRRAEHRRRMADRIRQHLLIASGRGPVRR